MFMAGISSIAHVLHAVGNGMTEEKRHAERIPVKLAVSVELVDNKTGNVLAGPVEGEARNFSPGGLALSLANIRMDRYHIFFSCQDNPAHILKIQITLPGDPRTTVEIPARPAWYDRDKDSKKEKRALLGVEFLLKSKDGQIQKLVKRFSAESKAPASWWKKKIFRQ